ncbi:SIMPL domain-containing protein [Alkalimonas mucilaginosa]|uniref:SIMPL domain-containing protein n=1 Tax=Alkalimonas mucilaginosa TaxID=3057676 RepID=A0ABU7JHP7_9GAMM|nr:SIMPL domain-containing protein [Alkalimonas sp. MEB004]MEE2024995.1 SIMPL domain-containing protein [Alkalimonas sp. MEB004]
MKLMLSSLLFASLMATATHASPVPDFPFVTVTGTAQMEVAPDSARITLVIRSNAETADAATSAVYQQGRSLLSYLQSKGVDLADIEAAQINKEATYQDYSSRVITGYAATQPVFIQLRSIEHYIDIMDHLFKQPNIFSIQGQFETSQKEQLEQELMAKAGADARQRAERLANAQGAGIHSVFAISEGSRSWGNLSSDFGFGAGSGVYGVQMRASADMAESSLVLPKHIRIQQSVNVIYRLAN